MKTQSATATTPTPQTSLHVASEDTPSTFYFTFGGSHPNKYGYIAIEAPFAMDARTAMFQLFGDRWGFQYSERPDETIFTDGEIARYRFNTAEQKPIAITLRCPHCHARAKPVTCRNCTRNMCEDCIQASGLCGLCEDTSH